jgi:hypothetical protein
VALRLWGFDSPLSHHIRPRRSCRRGLCFGRANVSGWPGMMDREAPLVGHAPTPPRSIRQTARPPGVVIPLASTGAHAHAHTRIHVQPWLEGVQPCLGTPRRVTEREPHGDTSAPPRWLRHAAAQGGTSWTSHGASRRRTTPVLAGSPPGPAPRPRRSRPRQPARGPGRAGCRGCRQTATPPGPRVPAPSRDPHPPPPARPGRPPRHVRGRRVQMQSQPPRTRPPPRTDTDGACSPTYSGTHASGVDARDRCGSPGGRVACVQ